MMVGGFGRRRCTHTWPPLNPSKSPPGRHHQRDARTHELTVCSWIILDPAAHVCVLAGHPRNTNAPSEEETVQWLVHDTEITQYQISQALKSYSFETYGASMKYESREFFKEWSAESHFTDRWSWEHSWSSSPIDSACVPSLPAAASKFGMSSSVELSSASLSDSTTMMWCHEYHCGECWWSSCNAPDPQYLKSAAGWFWSHAPMCGLLLVQTKLSMLVSSLLIFPRPAVFTILGATEFGSGWPGPRPSRPRPT